MSQVTSVSIPEWYDGKKINEVMFCDAFLAVYPMKCIRGQCFTVDGLVDDENMIRMEIYNRIKPFVTSSVAKKATQLMEALKLACYSEPLPVQLDRIHVANGTYFLDGTFSPEKEFCMNRLKVAYNPDAPVPTKWLSFLHDLLMDMDVLTVQEYTGYCLLPTNRAQKMLIILGKGGEGKSRIGITLRHIYGDNMNTGSMMKLETNQFFRANQEYKLVMVDDDMKMVALPETSYIKSMVTLEDKMDIERKGQQSVQRELYVRFIAFGNGTLQALYDHSYAFYRRQLILTTKDRPADRVDDRFLVEKFKEEAEGIFLWMLQGLHRLIENNFNFTESEQAKKNLEEAFADSNNIPAFLESSGYIRFEEGCQASSVHIYTAYLRWCDIDLDEGIIDVNHTLVHYDHREQGAKQGCYSNIHTPKTKAGIRQVQMLGFVKEAFLMEKEYQQMMGIKCEIVIDGYTDFIFLNKNGNTYHQGTVNKTIRRITRDCNDEVLLNHKGKEDPVLLPHFSCHSLRHTFTTRMCEAGVNVKVIQDTLGHADIATTLGIYADVTKEFKKEQFAGLENFFQGHRTLAAAENA